VNSGAGESVGSLTIPKSAVSPKRENDGFVRIGVDVVFHLDVLKPLLPKNHASDAAPGTVTKKQMSLELDDGW
jgi:hypothetical protein